MTPHLTSSNLTVQGKLKQCATSGESRSHEAAGAGVWMDLSGNQTNGLYGELQPFVDNGSGAVRSISPLTASSSSAASVGVIPRASVGTALVGRLPSSLHRAVLMRWTVHVERQATGHTFDMHEQAAHVMNAAHAGLFTSSAGEQIHCLRPVPRQQVILRLQVPLQQTAFHKALTLANTCRML